MNKRRILPGLMILIQLSSLGHLYYTYQYESSHIPAAFIELNILVVFNLLMLVLSYFFYFKSSDKDVLWRVPVSISCIVIVFALICYLMMGIDRYK